MGIFLYRAALGLLVAQSPTTHPDTVRAGLWARVGIDSTDGVAWLELGRSYLQLGDYHLHRKPVVTDTVWAHATLDTAQQAFERAARWSVGTRTADSARVFRVYTYGERAYGSQKVARRRRWRGMGSRKDCGCRPHSRSWGRISCGLARIREFS